MGRFFSELGRELIGLLPAVPAILWAISFHEFCHAWAALRCGDSSAERAGRLTLNPLAHFDPWGLLCMFLFHFGWAKPVPIDPRYFRKPRRDLLLVSIAGIAGNIATAIVFGIVIRLLVIFYPSVLMNYGLRNVILAFVIINLNFAVFNIIPIPPLDGSRILYTFLSPSSVKFIVWMERYSLFILLALIYTGIISKIMGPIVGVAFRFIIGY